MSIDIVAVVVLNSTIPASRTNGRCIQDKWQVHPGQMAGESRTQDNVNKSMTFLDIPGRLEPMAED